MIDEKLYNLRLELAKEKKAREESRIRYENTFGAQIHHISAMIDDENKQRLDSAEILKNVLTEEISKFNVQISEEQEEREQE